MRVAEVLRRVLHWRWLPFLAPIIFTLLFVGAAVLFVPDSLDGSGADEEESDEATSDSSHDPVTGLGKKSGSANNSGNTNKAPHRSRVSSSTRAKTSASRATRAPHDSRVTPPRTGPRSSYAPGPEANGTRGGASPPSGDDGEHTSETPPRGAAEAPAVPDVLEPVTDLPKPN